MTDTDELHRNKAGSHRDAAFALPPLQHQWPQLGLELFALEHLQADASGRKELGGPKEQQANFRNAIISQLYQEEEDYSRDLRYLAFLLLKQGRGGEIVGNPSTIMVDGHPQELPYTGLEGYYAGTERTAQLPGMSREEILLEEAQKGHKC